MDNRAVLLGVCSQIALVGALFYREVAVTVLIVAGVLSAGGVFTGLVSRESARVRFDGAAALLIGTTGIGGGLLVLARFRPSSLPAILVGGMFGGAVLAIVGLVIAIPFVGLYGAGCAVLGDRIKRAVIDGMRSVRGESTGTHGGEDRTDR